VKNMILCEDLNETIFDKNIPWRKLKNGTVLVTGATGAIGSVIVRTLRAASVEHNLDIKIIALGQNEAKAAVLVEKYKAIFHKHDIRKPIELSQNIDYIFHCAAVTSSAEMILNPLRVCETSLKGTENILVLAREKQVKSMVYLSSIEVYGLTDLNLSLITEKDLGYIDITNPRSCYPESKRMCEVMCNCWLFQHETPIKIARLAQTFGAGTPKDDTRVFAQFARAAVAGEDVVLHTQGKSRGNYCYMSDAVRGLFLLLLKGKNGEAYNVANPAASVTVREMAHLVADKVAGGKVSVVINIPGDIEKRGYAPDVSYTLSADKLMALGWKPKYGLVDMYERMIRDWHGG